MFHRLAHQWQLAQGPGDPHPLSSRAGCQTDAPGEPVGATQEAVVPALLFVELANQHEQFVGRRIDARGERGNLFAPSFLGVHISVFVNHLKPVSRSLGTVSERGERGVLSLSPKQSL